MSIDLEPASLRVVTIESVMAIRAIAYRSIWVESELLDALVDSLASARAEIASRFCARLNLDRARGLRPHWEKMMRFWAGCQTSEPRHFSFACRCSRTWSTRTLPTRLCSPPP